ncbi:MULTISPECIES: TonB-dependent hemoglobin/transferrin/lactoferrin family receptor [Pseudoalteromonas]|uniref:TonB-dependent hemoglobin/transferrin/lactoferrin family receptor n=1 Tax=Pseudoalteromonas TaxID=53246 RepID=UPI0015724EAA|nr:MULTISPECIES: TonB-dependent hemoglobin/transferrin/lactoferrin family receptor [Pseudoalteromonas]MBR8841808.1 TonB-dependent hemoglobin/transferrin/lactoferrin family receptor [Pseudoalteromonas sp. JC3]NSY35745.1 TonB-dependent hemoglobin/transferrin/lactoferrin family receptor [Pseudoalteromonas sp. JC28]QUI68649.1 TonB-dependent hemoglobin/transferrin/lactoferrin family receptor [Pseudoalteromonas sp. M8]UDM63695.1 TonB-dependent hemoglobin/transferrin/lactoferrin family receptor [Pseud
MRFAKTHYLRLLIASIIASGSTVALADNAVSADDLEVIVVSGSRSEKPLKDVAASISVMSSQDIEEQVITDVNQLFQYDPSIKITGRIGGAQNIQVRAMGGDRVLIIKDGMRMNEGYGADGLNDIVGRGFIDTDTIKQVEVAKGASSSLYGSDALGGIVVFTTKDASDYLNDNEHLGARVRIGYSDLSEQTNLSATLAGQHGNFDHLLSLTARDGKEEQNKHNTRAPFDIDSQSLLYKLKYNFNDKDYVNVSADLWRQDVSGDLADGLLAYFRGLAKYGYNIATESTETEKHTDSFRLSYHNDTGNSVWDTAQFNLYYTNSVQDDQEYALLDINAPMFGVIEKRDMWKTGTYEQTTYGFISHASKALDKQHTLGYGVDIETTESLRTVREYREVEGEVIKDDITNKFPKNDTLRAGLFINDEIKLLDDKLIVTPGLRFDYYSMDPSGTLKTDGTEFAKIDDQHLSFNLGGLYYLNNMLSVFAQYGQGFKVPPYDLAYIEHYNQASAEYLYEILPAEDLSPEESDTLELGLRGHIGDFTISTALFHNKFDNFLSTELISRETILDDEGNFAYNHDKFQYQNIDSVTIKGAEFSTTYYATDTLSVSFSATYQDGKNDETDEYISSINPLSGNLGFKYQNDMVSSDLILNFAKKMTKVNTGKYQTPGYGTIDWLAQVKLGDNTAVNLAIRNLFDKTYYQHGNLAGHGMTESLDGLESAGRSFAASIRYDF